LENGLGASGADITLTLIEVYNTAHMKPDSTNRGIFNWHALSLTEARLVQLLGMVDPSEPSRPRMIFEATEYTPMGPPLIWCRWSRKEGAILYGDPELHHSIGVLLANGPPSIIPR
jgi:hypothetical protein